MNKGGSMAEDLTKRNPSDYAAVCQFMLYLANSSTVITAFALKFTCGILGFVLLLCVLLFVRQNQNLHRNANIIVYAHYSLTMVASFGVFFNDGFDLFRLTVFRNRDVDDPNDCGIFSMPAYIGVWCRLLVFCGNAGSSISITALAIERSYATFYAKAYEKRGSKHLGIILVVICVLLCFVFAAFIGSSANFSRHLPMQSLTPEAVPRTSLIADILMIVELFNALVFIVLLLLNFMWKKHSNRIFATLTHKYQRKENVRSVSIVLPLAVLHLTISIAASLLTEIGSKNSHTNQEVLLVIITRDIYPLYDFLLPVYLLGYEYHRRRSARCEKGKETFMKKVGVHLPHEQDGHFEMLKNMFDAQYDKRAT
uniref:G_PROTEIN_RECEP_F1_2 domain-containing protein n=1 Tax=Steinernema glaseri TaxID=37863 RepID=A0A1I8AR73_9BILA